MKKILLSLIMLITISAAQTKWSADKSHSYVNFSVAHMVIADVAGTFKQFDIQAESSKDDFTDANILVTIKAKSIDTGTEGRDNHLRSADFFNVDIDSIVTFKSTKIEKITDKNLKITGDLTIRGITKEVVLDTQYKGKIKGYKGMVAAFKASTTINRKDWGLTWNRAIEAGGVMVGETVDITIAAELVQG